jgi:hypothetical protein
MRQIVICTSRLSEVHMLVKSFPLSNAQVDAHEQLAKADIESVANRWVAVGRPRLSPIRQGTVRALMERDLCRRILSPGGRELAQITQTGRAAVSEIQAVRARIHSAA